MKPERLWTQDPRYNPELRSELPFEPQLYFTGGVRLYPASRLASIGARLMTFGTFKEIRFDWPGVQRVERMRA